MISFEDWFKSTMMFKLESYQTVLKLENTLNAMGVDKDIMLP